MPQPRTQLDVWNLNASWVFVLGLLAAAAGSMVTGWYFAGSVLALAAFLLRSAPFRLPQDTWLALMFPLLLFVSKLPSPLFYENPDLGWTIVGSNLQLIFLPVIVASLRLTLAIDYLTLFLRGIRIGLPIAFLTGLFQGLFLQSDKIEGLMGNPKIYASLAATSGLIALIGMRKETLIWRRLSTLGFASAIGITAMTLYPTALIVLAFGAALMLTHWLANGRPALLNIAAGFLLCVACLTAGLFAAFSQDQNFERHVADRFQRIAVMGPRMDALVTAPEAILQQHGLVLFRENALTGVGLQNTVKRALALEADPPSSIASDTHLHSEYINAAAGSGLPGLAATLLFIMAPLLVTFGSRYDARFPERLMLATVLTSAYAIFGLSNLLTNHDLMLGFYCGTYAILILANHQARFDTRLALARRII
jgi:hypothetical protein